MLKKFAMAEISKRDVDTQTKYINAHCRTSERARMGNYNVLGKIKEAC